MNWYFIFFFISGFCSVLYELVWLRLSMAQFGVTTAMVSIVLSVFMAGLGLGSWVSGKWLGGKRGSTKSLSGASLHESENRGTSSALRLYALTELLIGISGILVPYGLFWGRRVLEHSGLSSSVGYYSVAGLWVAVILLPWCTLMGATVPVAMQAIGQTIPKESRRSFSYLYTANVCGAVAGTIIPLFLIELFGFRGTLRIGALCNAFIAISAFTLSRSLPRQKAEDSAETSATSWTLGSNNKSLLALLFLSGLTSMAMEVVWVRCYTPYFGTMVYAFASILGIYLLATLLGSVIYRRWSERSMHESPVVWSLLASCALLPLVLAGPGIHLSRVPRLAIGIGPFTALLGFITPMLVDRVSGGNPAKAGAAYATNIVGCILGPLLAGFGLLPVLSERWSLVVLTLPWLAVGLFPLRPSLKLPVASRSAIYAFMALAAILVAAGKGYEEAYPDRRVLRDATATVIATGTGMDKELLVNGYGMTNLTTITKEMAHLPLAFLDREPQNALVICFGMGTTFRSLHTWSIPVTAVELVPSVPRLFSYYHDDGEKILASPIAHVVIDDGRRYLERTTQQYDVITIDPPPPLQAAGSSMLYSEEFYRVAGRRLRPGGILQQWLPATPEDDPMDVSAVSHSIGNSFAYVRAFRNAFGIHYLCSDRPIPNRTTAELLQRMPAAAVADLAEWALEENPNGAPNNDPPTSSVDADTRDFNALLTHEVPLQTLIALSPNTPALSDDRPINEYYVLRRWMHQR